MSKSVNVYGDYRFQRRFKTPDSDGVLNFPSAAGVISGITLRLSATPTGAALHANVDNLSATEVTTKPGRFFKVIDTALLVTYVLPLGVGASFYVIWSRAGDLDRQYTRFIVADRDHD